MYKKMLVLTAIMAVVFAILTGCDNNKPGQARSVVTVSSLNANQPHVSDILEQGDSMFVNTGFRILAVTTDDFIAADMVPVIFYNRPYNSMIATEPGMPHGDFVISRYRVRWERTDSGTFTLPDYEAGLGLSIPSGEESEASILLVTYDNKFNTVLWDLNYLGTDWDQEVHMDAHITFYGYESGTDREIAIETTLGVVFVDLVVESD